MGSGGGESGADPLGRPILGAVPHEREQPVVVPFLEEPHQLAEVDAAVAGCLRVGIAELVRCRRGRRQRLHK